MTEIKPRIKKHIDDAMAALQAIENPTYADQTMLTLWQRRLDNPEATNAEFAQWDQDEEERENAPKTTKLRRGS